MISRVPKPAIMDFGYSAEDADMLVELAQDTLRHVRGQHEELTREVASIHRVLKRLRRALANPDFLLDRADDDRRQDLDDLGRICEQILNAVNTIVTKYDHRSTRKPWSKAKFQPDEMQDLASIKFRLSKHKKAIRMTLNPRTSTSQSKVEKELDSLEELDGIMETVGPIAARITRQKHNESEWTSYEEDDSGSWRDLRRELVKKGYSSHVLCKYEHLIKQYLVELGQKGALDQNDEIPVDTGTIDAGNFQHDEFEESLASAEETGEEDEQEKGQLDTENAVVQDLESQGVADYADDLTDTLPSSPISVFDYLLPSDDEEVSFTEPAAPKRRYSDSDLPLFKNSQDTNEPSGASPDSSFCPSIGGTAREYPKVVQIEDILDEDFMPGAHKMVCSEEEFESEQLADQKDKSLLDRLRRSRISMMKIKERLNPVRPSGASSFKPQQNNNSSAVTDGPEVLPAKTEQEDGAPSSTASIAEEESQQQIPEYFTKIPNYVFWETGTLDPYGAKLRPKPVKVKDAIGRKFAFPFQLCKTWKVTIDHQHHVVISNMCAGNGKIVEHRF